MQKTRATAGTDTLIYTHKRTNKNTWKKNGVVRECAHGIARKNKRKRGKQLQMTQKLKGKRKKSRRKPAHVYTSSTTSSFELYFITSFSSYVACMTRSI